MGSSALLNVVAVSLLVLVLLSALLLALLLRASSLQDWLSELRSERAFVSPSEKRVLSELKKRLLKPRSYSANSARSSNSSSVGP